jgi:hypothetical protein
LPEIESGMVGIDPTFTFHVFVDPGMGVSCMSSVVMLYCALAATLANPSNAGASHRQIDI